jgi:hypothetical protein
MKAYQGIKASGGVTLYARAAQNVPKISQPFQSGGTRATLGARLRGHLEDYTCAYMQTPNLSSIFTLLALNKSTLWFRHPKCLKISMEGMSWARLGTMTYTLEAFH